ncbi:hypothetical protein BHM03_00030667 [Ensete ventricosum]|nr:hypothetical protein BHM03_00030667 [Ensete ventricosum]
MVMPLAETDKHTPPVTLSSQSTYGNRAGAPSRPSDQERHPGQQTMPYLGALVKGDRARQEGENFLLLRQGIQVADGLGREQRQQLRVGRGQLGLPHEISGGVRYVNTQATQLSGMSPRPGPPDPSLPASVKFESDAPISPPHPPPQPLPILSIGPPPRASSRPTGVRGETTSRREFAGTSRSLTRYGAGDQSTWSEEEALRAARPPCCPSAIAALPGVWLLVL